MISYVIGIDGGGTKTEMIARAADGTDLETRTLSGSNLYARPQEETEETLRALLCGCVKKFGAPAAVCMGAAGMIGAHSESVLKAALARAANCSNLLVCNDAKIALYANFQDGAGLSLTAGTGSICVAQNGGELFRAGGWGHLISDEGSAYDLVKRALTAVVRSHDGACEKTLLYRAFCERTGSASFEELIDAVYRRYAEKSAFASLADVVSACALAGDDAAVSVLEETADRLYNLCALVAERAGLSRSSFEVCYNGGVLVGCRTVREKLTDRLQTTFECRVRDNTERAVYGALALAQNML